MTELWDGFKEMNRLWQVKRNKNMLSSKQILDHNQIDYIEKANGHMIIDNYDFWTSTWLFIHRKTKKRWRGVYNLLKKLYKEKIPDSSK